MTPAEAVWLAPAVTALHFLEEAPRFAKWARVYISSRYTGAHWRKVHAAGMLVATIFAGMVALWPRPATVFLFLALYLAPMLFNMMFHVGVSYYSGSYSPGVCTAVLLFPALFWYLATVFSRAGLITAQAGMLATAIGAAAHSLDLLSTTFFIEKRNISLPSRP